MNPERMKNLIVSQNTSVKTAMKLLGSIGAEARVLFVVDKKEKLIGSVTDGDIRRSILNNAGFERPISEIMFKSPRFVRRADKAFEEQAKRFVLDEKLYAVPVLDENDRMVDVLSWVNFFKNHPHEEHSPAQFKNTVVIMAGGKGTRLDPFTKILPKPLIPLGDKPIVEKIMDNFCKYGFNNFMLTLNYKKEIIKMYFRENRFPYNVEWVEEDEYLGTAGGLALLKDKLKDTFFVCNCDVLLENDFKNILLWHKGEKAILTLIGCHKEMVMPFGTLEVNNGYLKAIKEKPTFDVILNTGVYVMEPDVLNYISPGEHIDMNCLIERIISKEKVTIYPICQGWFDLGEWKDYKESVYNLQNNHKSD